MELGVSREDVRALVIGEHGDSMVPLVECASVSGIPVTKLLAEERMKEIVNMTVSSGADVINMKGSTIYAPAAVIAVMADAILKDRKRVIGVSTYLDGEYGLSGIAIGVPVVLGKNGVERILQLELTAETRKRFENSASVVREALKMMG
jgi:malate dehydrogenase